MRSYPHQGAVNTATYEPRREVRDEEIPVIPGNEFRNMITDLRKAWADFGNILEDRTHRVDEYQVQSLGPTSASTVTLQPEYEVSEIIEAIIVTGPETSAVQGNSICSNVGQVTNPTAGTAIVTLASVPAGQYQASVFADFNGTLAAGDLDNMQFQVGATVIRQLAANITSAGSAENAFVNSIITVPPGGATLSVNAIANASGATAGYRAQIILTPLTVNALPSFSLQLGKRYWTLLLPASGILPIAPVRFSLGRNDVRQLTSSVPGDWSLELCGYANFTESYRTLA